MKKTLFIALILVMICMLSSCTLLKRDFVAPNTTTKAPDCITHSITQGTTNGTTQSIESGPTNNPNPTVKEYLGGVEHPDGELKKAKLALEESVIVLENFYFTQNLEDELYEQVGECLDGIGVSYWVSIGYGTDLIIDGQNVLKVGFDYSVRVWEKMDVNHVQEIKLDLKANITVSDMPTLNQDQRGWQHKQNAGNQAHLASAVNIIRQNNIMQSIRVMRLFDYDFNRYQYATMLSVYLYHLLKSYDVYVDLIEGPYELCWDNWDENGNWYGGTDFVYDITIYAGGAISTAFVKADSL